jgi:hypothetical protein
MKSKAWHYKKGKTMARSDKAWGVRAYRAAPYFEDKDPAFVDGYMDFFEKSAPIE